MLHGISCSVICRSTILPDLRQKRGHKKGAGYIYLNVSGPFFRPLFVPREDENRAATKSIAQIPADFRRNKIKWHRAILQTGVMKRFDIEIFP